MSKFNILFKISGSIAAYKSAVLISKLVQNKFNVQTVITQAGLEFIGKATLEGLTSRRVLTDTFQDGEMMSHINLVKWADLTILSPATANTLNKMASGIGDNIVTSLFLAHDWSKPYLIAPAMNTGMYEHPATQDSFGKLKKWGVDILPTEEGYLACGDYGKGKLLNSDQIYDHILNRLDISENYPSSKKLNVLITAGGTRESIDNVRYITNLSTGRTAASLAEHLVESGHQVTYLHSEDTAAPEGIYSECIFTNFLSLNNYLKDLLSNNTYDCVIHNAAVSDFSPIEVIVNKESFKVPLSEKLPSKNENIILNMKKNFKIVEKIKEYSKNKNIKLVSFKFTNVSDLEERVSQVKKLFKNSGSDFVVHNDFNDRSTGNEQRNFSLYNSEGKLYAVKTAKELVNKLERLIK